MKAGIADSLEITRSVSDRNVTIGAGKAVVQGMLYENTADVIINVPTPSGSNQRIDFIILRYDPSEPLADRIVLALVQGAEAVSPIAPALTQSATGVWEHPLAVIGPYGTGVISAAPFALLSPVASRRFFVPIGSYASPNAMPGLVANFRDEAFDETGRVWQLNASGVWELMNPGAGVPVQDDESADFTTTTAYPTFAAGSPVCGVAFVAPPSGRVFVTVTGYLSSPSNTRRGFLSYEMKTGSTIGSGSSVITPADSRAVVNSMAVTSGGPSFLHASFREMISGLTPGASYNARTMHAHQNGAINIWHRRILVEPA
jgi:hypothetical protein